MTEIVGSLRFFVDYIQGKPSTRSKSPREGGRMNFGDAFGITTSEQPTPNKQMDPRVSSEEVLLSPYDDSPTRDPDSPTKDVRLV